MVERVLDKMEILDLILDEVQRTRKESESIREELRTHIKEESDDFRVIHKNINELKIQDALRKQQSGYIAAMISVVVTSVMSFLVMHFGRN